MTNTQYMFTFPSETEIPNTQLTTKADRVAWYRLFNRKRKYVYDIDDIVSIDKIEQHEGYDSVFVYVTLSFMCEGV